MSVIVAFIFSSYKKTYVESSENELLLLSYGSVPDVFVVFVSKCDLFVCIKGYFKNFALVSGDGMRPARGTRIFHGYHRVGNWGCQVVPETAKLHDISAKNAKSHRKLQNTGILAY